MTALPEAFLRLPIAHRALHDAGRGRPENSRAAIVAAITHGYGIEIDLQLSGDGQAMVFHDYVLGRLTAETGAVRQRSAAELGGIRLSGTDEGVPDLPEVLALVGGRVPLLVEMKDQHGAMGETDGRLESAVAQALTGYDGPVAVMSFNPEMVARLAGLAPHVPRGLVTSAFDASDWPLLHEDIRHHLRDITDLDRTGAAFISHKADDLARPRVAGIRAAGMPVLCWTIRSRQAEAEARRVADNITFEGYLADIPG